MKKILSILFFLAIALPGFAQVNIEEDDTDDDDMVMAETDSTVVEPAHRIPVDTLRTKDKYTDVILYDNQTWDYLTYPRPGIDSTTIYDRFWNTEALHAYRGFPKDSIPDEVDLPLADSTHGYCAPCPGPVHSSFKVRKRRPHNGCDLPLHTGDPVKAAFDGVVRFSSGSNTGGYGNLVIVRHSNGLETYYGHLSKRLVIPGEPVKAGDVIGLGGSTGRSTGPHLHLETRYKGHPFDPERLFDFSTGTLRDSLFTLKKHYLNIYSHYGQTDQQSVTASQQPAPSQYQYYKVRKGDTLSKIASRHGTTVAKICKLNGISTKKPIRIGQTLRVR